MNRLLTFVFVSVFALSARAADPLRVFIRAGESNRGREVHAHPRFLEEWKPLLAARGMQVDGALDWPTAEQFAKTDVLVLYAQDGGNATEIARHGNSCALVSSRSAIFTCSSLVSAS